MEQVGRDAGHPQASCCSGADTEAHTSFIAGASWEAFLVFNLLAAVKLQDRDRVPRPLHCDWMGRRSGASLGSGGPDSMVAAAVKLSFGRRTFQAQRYCVPSPCHRGSEGQAGPSLEQTHSPVLVRKPRALQPARPPAPPHKTPNSGGRTFSPKVGSSWRAGVTPASFLHLPRIQHCVRPEEPGQDC